MFNLGHIYTVHVKQDAEPEERAVLVREGFSIGAFLFGMFWLLYQRLWIAAAFFFALEIGLLYYADYLRLNDLSYGILQVGLHVWLGATGFDLKRWTLERQGYRLKEVAVAESEMLAARRYYDRQVPRRITL